jgi:dienelactone hydrolase
MAGASAGGGGGGARATATWFGPEDRPLFGWVHVPRDAGGQGVVLCPSLGLEGEASQMAYRTLARSLADAGCTVLRFDYHGTGDSTGFLTDPDRLDEWLSDISAGLAYLRAAGATRLHLVGARLGAALAVRAAAAEDDVESLTLWYPWTKGSQFLRYQRALRRLYAMGDSLPTGDGSTEIPGFVLGAPVCADLGTLDSAAPDLSFPKAVLVVDAADPDTGEVTRPEFAPAWAVRRNGTGLHDLFGVELMRATVPEGDVAAIGAFVLDCPTPDGPVTIAPEVRTQARVEPPGTPPVVERPVTFGDSGLFGILAEPADPASHPPRGPRVRTSGGPVPEFTSALFLNAGSLHHVGPGRQWVELSRQWAARGVRCLRMDLGGIGDSPATGPPGLLSSYPPSAERDIAQGVAFLAPDDPGGLVMLGLCAGAFHSLLAAPHLRVGGVAVLNPLRLPSARQAPGSMGDLIDGAPAGGWASTEEEQRAATVHRRRFLGSLRDRGVFHPVTKRLPDRFWWAAHLGRGGSDPVDAFRRVVDSGASVCIVLGPDEWPGIGRGRTHELRRLSRSGVFAITYVPTLDHSFHVASGRRDALELLDQWVLGTGPDGPHRPPGTRTIS